MDLSDEKSCAQKVTPLLLLFSDEWVEMVDGNFRPKIRRELLGECSEV